MNVQQVLTVLSRNRIRIQVEGSNLALLAPKGVVTQEIRELVASHKRQIIDTLAPNDWATRLVVVRDRGHGGDQAVNDSWLGSVIHGDVALDGNGLPDGPCPVCNGRSFAQGHLGTWMCRHCLPGLKGYKRSVTISKYWHRTLPLQDQDDDELPVLQNSGAEKPQSVCCVNCQHYVPSGTGGIGQCSINGDGAQSRTTGRFDGKQRRLKVITDWQRPLFPRTIRTCSDFSTAR